MTVPALLTEAEAAAQIGVAARTLRALRARGEIRYVRPSPRKIYYRAEDQYPCHAEQAKALYTLAPDQALTLLGRDPAFFV